MFTLTFTEPGQRPRSLPLINEEQGLLAGREAGCDHGKAHGGHAHRLESGEP